MVVNPPTKQLNRESTLAHQTSGNKQFVKSLNRALKAFGFYGRNYIIEAGKLTGFERFVSNKKSICNLFSLFKGVWVNSRSHKLRRLCGKVNLIRTAKVRCKNSVDNFIALNHQFRLSVTIATELYLLPFFYSLTHVPVPFFWCNTVPEV